MIYKGVFESLQMAIIATTILLAVPLALGAAANISVKFVYAISRAFIVIARSFPPILVAIIFVKAFGFMGKLLAEAIENIDKGQVEAVRATGAKVFTYGVLPQVLPIIIGTSIFRWDINIRQSAVIGLVGAGGIGILLTSSMNLFKWQNSLGQFMNCLYMAFQTDLILHISLLSIYKECENKSLVSFPIESPTISPYFASAKKLISSKKGMLFFL